MTPTKRIPLKDIIVGNRLRTDYGDLSDLLESIPRYDIIQPLVINQHNQLIAGGRRYFAAEELGLEDVPIIYKETLNEAHLREMELEENLRRKDMSWQEAALGVLEIHLLRTRDANAEGKRWELADTGILLGRSPQRVHQILPVARYIKTKPESEAAKADSLLKAYQIIMAELETKAKQLAAQQAVATGMITPSKGTLPPVANPALAATLATALAGMQVTTPAQLQQQGVEAMVQPSAPVTRADGEPEAAPPVEKAVIDLGSMIFCGNSIELMLAAPDECVDHIITDPPYAIEMDNIQQDGGGMNVDSTRAEHQVVDNLQLLRDFISVAPRLLKPRGWLIMWCDATRLNWLTDQLESQKLRVQQWPFVWCKPSAQNMQSGKNMTKATEFAILACKGTEATLATHQPINWMVYGETDEDRKLPHPFAKPPEVWKRLIEAVTQPGQLILDPFAGCGSLGLATLRLGRRFKLIEKTEHHFNDMLSLVAREIAHSLSQPVNFHYSSHPAF